MQLSVLILLFIVGLLLTAKGGDLFVDSAAWIAEVSGVPKFLIGATIVSVATTLPELFVSILAAIQGNTELAVGNAIGSVSANITLILGIALLFLPTAIERRDYLAQSAIMLGASALLLMSGFSGQVGFLASILLLALFVCYVGLNISSAKNAVVIVGKLGVFSSHQRPPKSAILKNGAKFLVGAAFIVIGARILVNSGTTLAERFGISERVIGVTLVAVGTSLPELVTAITAIVKKQSALSVGNIIGANIIDLTLILPLGTLITGKALPVSPEAARIDILFCLLGGCLALLPALAARAFRRWQGAALISAYLLYLLVTVGVI